MSDTARNYVKSLQAPWHIKSLLFLIADYHNVKKGCAWPGYATLAEVTGRDQRSVRRTMREAERILPGKIHFAPGLGRGNFGKFYFTELEKGVAGDLFSGRDAAPKGDTKGDTKGDISDSAIRNEPLNHGTIDQSHQNITPNGALSFWLRFKDQLKAELPQEDWKLWLRPLFFLKEIGSNHLLLALPPDSRIKEAYKAKEPWLRSKLKPLGYCCSATKYPDEYELGRACEINPEWIEVRERLLRKKKEPQRAAG
jgi:hypothetical protein